MRNARIIVPDSGKTPPRKGQTLAWFEMGEDDPREITAREIEILQLTSLGWYDRHISAALGISFSTVRTHWFKIFDKLHAKNRCGAVATAIRKGLI